MATIAFLGTGTMGFPMARNAARAGLTVRAWNRSREKAEPLAEEGVTIHATPREAADGADVIVTMLRDADAVISVMEGEEGSLAAAKPGTTWAQMSTIGLEGTARCLALARDHRIDFVDAPVLGTKQPAEQGELIVLASGPDQALERCRPLFEAVGKRTVHAGEGDRATRLKLVVNNWIVTVVEGVAETLALAEALGLDPRLFLDAIAGGPTDSPYVQTKGKAMLDREFSPSFKLELALKDTRLVLDAAERAGVELPLARAVEDRFAKAAALGHGDEDMAAAYYASTQR